MNEIKKPSLEKKWLLCPFCGAKTILYDNTANCTGIFLNDKMTSVSIGIWEAFYHRNTIANGVPGIEELREKSKFTVRPFRCRVHAQKRFELGQQIRINYQDIADSSAVRIYNSIITSIQWTFRGGHTIACGGEDSRVMADCLRSTKGDKALKETRNRCAALEQKIAALS